MKTLKKYDQLAIPTYSLPYLVNSDATGLTDEDQSAIDSFMRGFYDEAKALGGNVLFCDDAGCTPYFCKLPEFGLACDCVDAEILICK